ncbi:MULTISPECIES: hypothetical protein [Bacteria]|uniref:hypothetical protein n=1 Tax=Bacteria TaxID=2 RepID=UPI003C7E5CA2
MTADESSSTQDSDRRAFADAFSRAVAARDLSLRELHRRLTDRGNPVSVATLSAWRTGARYPEGAQSRTAVVELEEILGLGAGVLERLVRWSRRSGQVRSVGAVFSDHELAQIYSETEAALSATNAHLLRVLHATVVADVSASRGVREHSYRLLVQATSGVVDAISIATLFDERIPEIPRLVARGGGKFTRRYLHPTGAMVGARYELDAPVAAPGTVFIEYVVQYPESFPVDRSCGYGVARRAREVAVWVRFDPAALPAWVEEFEDIGHGEVSVPLQLTGASAHVVRRGFGPGVLAIRWGSNDEADVDRL